MNGEIERRFGWPHLRDLLLIIGVLAGGGFSYNANDQASDIKEHVARVDERVLAHLGNHPNVGLQRQIDAMNRLREQRDDAMARQIDDLQRRIRDLELQTRAERYTAE